LSWVNRSYHDLTNPPSSENCSDTRHWRWRTLDMNTVLVGNELYIDARVPGRREMPIAIPSPDSVMPARLPGLSKLPDLFRTRTRLRRSNSVPLALASPLSPMEFDSIASALPRTEYANHDVRFDLDRFFPSRRKNKQDSTSADFDRT